MEECEEIIMSKINNNSTCDVFFPYNYVLENYEFHSTRIFDEITIEKYVRDVNTYIENEKHLDTSDIVYV